MIVWGGYDGATYCGGSPCGLATGGRYNPSTDSWTAISTDGAPSARWGHTAVWTGSEMIVWGGYGGATYLATGARYNPSTDSWTAISTDGAPSARRGHTAVWAGSEMIVWGGDYYYSNIGGRYNPGTDSWVPTNMNGAPDGRTGHTAIWTGSEMIVWGGSYPVYVFIFTVYVYPPGGRYNPSTDSWVATSEMPAKRAAHAAVWTGTEMIVWGGYYSAGHPTYFVTYNTGGRYNPSTDSWIATTTNGAPSGPGLASPTAVWTGNEMMAFLDWNTSWRYSPTYYNWTSTNISGALDMPSSASSVWTGNQLIVWGGGGGGGAQPPVSTGGRYCPPSAPAQLGNISTRLAVQTGDNALIGGFIIAGAQTKRVLIRALGPSVPVPGTLADPVLELHPSGGPVITNDNWRDSQEAEIIASGRPPPDNAESAIIATLAPGPHTAIVRGTNQTTGVALMEVWDLDSNSSSTMANVSTRGFVQTGDNVMIGGTVIDGGASSNILVRAIGPSLSGSGVPNALGDPTLALHDRNGAVVATNDNWRDTQEAEIQATGLAPTNDFESAILRTVSPGPYTAIVRGNNETIGVSLVEVYALP